MRIFVVDAFTDRAFAGNPAGVCLLEKPVEPGWMQAVAAEMRHSETAFVRALDQGFELRWFTPETEVRLCGHATLAAARALYAEGLVGAGEEIEFSTLSGVLTVRQEGAGLRLDFPSVPAERIEAPPGLAAALGAEPVFTARNTQNDILAVLPDAATVRRLRPDMALLATLDARGVCATAPGDADADADFVSRFFAPSVGVPEDPVTGSAHCMLAPYWAERLGRSALTGLQVSSRPGRVGVELADGRVALTGEAVIVLIGELMV
ncbi:PhzF family phenazine biosynthesis protein [Actinocorallia sp. API 0066]|uniref:PhzF family phenazine biosynthesis protein n=1 Tax=Actinocorallia sp. API 0066 TaxID=2896846 RepID=UPI001E4BC4F5|nr:PhzF family phenazine biosynthesis protein [Actinocorallia sp. API 0066]MCD0450796.1 PhzF family phenazine biosynthesis protein [Actinocorallia sp. API 0066]